MLTFPDSQVAGMARRRSKGKKPTVMGIEFGEKILFKVKLGAKMEKINPRWDFGIFVGIKRRSNELMVARPDGIMFARSVRRIPVEKRWGEDCVNWVVYVPWKRYKDHDGDGEETGHGDVHRSAPPPPQARERVEDG